MAKKGCIDCTAFLHHFPLHTGTETENLQVMSSYKKKAEKKKPSRLLNGI